MAGVYKIAFVAEIQNCCHDHILFLVSGRHSQTDEYLRSVTIYKSTGWATESLYSNYQIISCRAALVISYIVKQCTDSFHFS